MEQRKNGQNSLVVSRGYLVDLEALCNHVVVGDHDLVSIINILPRRRIDEMLTAFGRPVVPLLKLRNPQRSLFV